ncbi:SPFH domain-containing protein [Variovorax sp. PAMC26660]|uniref:SPFH domain-containing protein n=1 Tax=Variovorax sp. PAMC26660 TaxID=2762322 RepID=UPI00164E2E87|nr:SPFH domain-containing protein [Variovorax sp. PAMC26660]QNK68046.1 SPFH domain-containing protein [Variovorax sp. PAMC26660]
MHEQTLQPPRSVRKERPYRSVSGYGIAVAVFLLVALGVWAMVQRLMPLPMSILLIVVGVALLPGLYMLQPNEGIILTLFGQYKGTDRSEGLRWTNPLQAGQKISLRARNLNTPPLKVNDKRGNPVEIGAAVVWQVYDTAQAVFEIDDYNKFVAIQAEAAIRHLATQYAYDSGDDLQSDEVTLRAGLDVVADALKAELNQRFASAGVEVLDAKLTHLAYAPEIAQVMLRRQQAVAIVSARHQIVAGAVGMVEAALKGLSERNLVVLDDERKASMVSNLLVVLCSDRETQPVVNTGTLYT